MSNEMVAWLKLKFDTLNVNVVATFPVLHHAWECDGYGWVVKVEGQSKLVLTNHGSPYIAEPEELMSFIESYGDAIASTKEALELLK